MTDSRPGTMHACAGEPCDRDTRPFVRQLDGAKGGGGGGGGWWPMDGDRDLYSSEGRVSRYY